jgi:pSer/pThr/pTyr-binding forkhead associated (FHA) protein
MAIVLLIKTPDGEVSELPVLNRIVLGRSSSSDYKISDEKMSGMHCAFEVSSKGQLLFKDLGSTNGSFINNSQVQEVHVKVNDIIRIGDTFIRIDEKRLSKSDKSVIGISSMKSLLNDKTLPEISQIGKKPKPQKSNSDDVKKRPVIGLSDKMKQAKEKDKEDRENNKIKWGSTKNVMDKESTTGNTKFLELNEEKKKKKKF